MITVQTVDRRYSNNCTHATSQLLTFVSLQYNNNCTLAYTQVLTLNEIIAFIDYKFFYSALLGVWQIIGTFSVTKI